MIRILIVEDNEALRDLFRAIFQRAGYELRTARNGEQALRWLETEKFDVLIADVAMPELTGLELYQRTKEIDPELAARTILISGIPDRQTRELAESDHIPCFFKPFDVRQLLEFVEQMVHAVPR